MFAKLWVLVLVAFARVRRVLLVNNKRAASLFKVREWRISKMVKATWRGIVWVCRKVTFATAWCTAQIVRLCTDIERRKRVCQQVTDPASQAVARSLTLKVVYTAATVYLICKGFIVPAIALVVVLGLARLVWGFVLYTAALVSRMDYEMETTVSMTKDLAASLGSKAAAVVAAVPAVPATN